MSTPPLRTRPRPSHGLVSLLVLAAVAGCSDESVVAPLPVDRQGIVPLDLAVVQDEGLTGCARIVVSRQGKKDVSAEAPTTAECGPLSAVVQAVAFDNATNVVSLRVTVENRGATPARPPVLLASWEDSLRVLSPPGLARNRHSADYLTFDAPDSVAPVDDPTWPAAAIWRADTLVDVASPDVTQTFAAATLRVVVHPGVREFEVLLRLRGEPATQEVPQEIPRELPADLNDNVDPWWGAPVDYLMLMFVPGTSVQEKTRLVGLVGGEVRGGTYFGDQSYLGGYYAVKIATDGTMGPLLAASDLLEQEDSVVSAVPLLPSDPDSRTPDDGGAWATWQTNPRMADGDNWAQELVSAPLAWGCSVGDPATPVAIVDRGFHDIDELRGNVASGSYDGGPGSHGTRVASVLAAQGNNQQGMTGMMWHAGLMLENVGDGAVTGVVGGLEAAIRGGARVVNISYGRKWPEGYTPHTAEDEAIVEEMHQGLLRPLRQLVQGGGATLPLIVLTAGNSGLPDAFWNGYPRIAQDYPANVLVVGAVAPGRPSSLGTVLMWAGSNRGRNVDIAAPGQDVAVLDSLGNVTTTSGTSFAAPMVAGTAGLLLSFDPSIPNDQLRGLILEGAQREGFRTVFEGHPVLNAYAALKAAAQRPGAPVCGNAVASDGTRLLVDRGGTWDEIARVAYPSGDLTVAHGSSMYAFTFDAEFDFADEWIRYEDESWRVDPIPDGAEPDVGGFELSQRGLSHDGLTRISVSPDFPWPSGSARWTVTVSGPAGTVTANHSEPRSGSSVEECVRRYHAVNPNTGEVILSYCERTNTIYSGDVFQAEGVLSPLDGRVLLVVNKGTQTQALGDWVGCGPERQCKFASTTITYGSARVAEFDMGTGDASTILELPSLVEGLGVSEDGKELVFRAANLREEFGRGGQFLLKEACTVRVHDAATGVLLNTAPEQPECFRIEGGDPVLEESSLFGHGS